MTTFQSPLKTIGASGDTGDTQTETSGFVHSTKVLSLDATNARKIITLPPQSTLTGLRACTTSAGGGSDTVSAFSVNWGNSGQATRYGIIAVSALGAIRAAAVSAGTDFDTGGTIVVTLSANSTTTFTAGGVRAFIDYITVG